MDIRLLIDIADAIDNQDTSVLRAKIDNELSRMYQEEIGRAKITPQLIKKLRENTGLGMIACKMALTRTNGDYDEAMEYLRSYAKC